MILEGDCLMSSNRVELIKDIADDESVYSLEEEDEETQETIRAYIG
jgi:hypothetical protein